MKRIALLFVLFLLSTGAARADESGELEAVLLQVEVADDPAARAAFVEDAVRLAGGPGPLAEYVRSAREADEEGNPSGVALGRAACAALSTTGDAGSLQALALALLDGAAPPALREAALVALEARRDPRSILPLADLVDSDGGEVPVVEYEMPDKTWRPVRQLLDPELALRVGAARLLGSLAEGRNRRLVLDRLRSSLEGPSPGSRVAAALALAGLSLSPAERQAALLDLRRAWRREEIEDVREALVTALVAHGEAADAELLRPALGERPPLASRARDAIETLERREAR